MFGNYFDTSNVISKFMKEFNWMLFFMHKILIFFSIEMFWIMRSKHLDTKYKKLKKLTTFLCWKLCLTFNTIYFIATKSFWKIFKYIYIDRTISDWTVIKLVYFIVSLPPKAQSKRTDHITINKSTDCTHCSWES